MYNGGMSKESSETYEDGDTREGGAAEGAVLVGRYSSILQVYILVLI